MKDRFRRAFDDLKISQSEKEKMFDGLCWKCRKKRHFDCRKVAAVLISAMLVLVAVIYRQPITALARQLFYPGTEYYSGKAVEGGEVRTVDINIPDGMRDVKGEVIKAKRIKGQDYGMEWRKEERILGHQKEYSTLAEMESEIGVQLLRSPLYEEDTEGVMLTVYDSISNRMAVVDTRFTLDNSRKDRVCMEIVFEMDEQTDGYGYGNVGTHLGKYEHKGGLFDAQISRNSQMTAPCWSAPAESPDEDGDCWWFDHIFVYPIPENSYQAVFYYDGIRYYVYGVQPESQLKEIIDSFHV